MTDEEALIRAQIEETREDLAQKVEAIRAKVDVRHRSEQKLQGLRANLTTSVDQFRQGFAGTTPGSTPGTEQHQVAGRRGARVRELGEASVASGWRRTAAEKVAPRVAGSAPVSGEEVRAALGLAFLALSGSYVLKTVLTALRHRDLGRPQLSARTARIPVEPTYAAALDSDTYRRIRPVRLGRGGQL